LPDAHRVCGGKYQVDHFTGKANVARHITKLGLPASFIELGSYYQNWLNNIKKYAKKESNTYTIILPNVDNKPIPGVDVNDVGEAVVNMLHHREDYLGKTIALCGDNKSMFQYVDELNKFAAGKVKFQLKSVSSEEFLKERADQPMAKELSEMFKFISEFGYFGGPEDKQKCQLGHNANPQMKRFADWLQLPEQKQWLQSL